MRLHDKKLSMSICANKRKEDHIMPLAPGKPCIHPGCPLLAVPGKNRCERHLQAQKEKVKSDSRKRQRKSGNSKLYSHKWRRYRKMFLAEHPLCVHCQEQGRITPATVVDHIKAHKGDHELFWTMTNHQSLCARCHSIKTNLFDGGLGNR